MKRLITISLIIAVLAVGGLVIFAFIQPTPDTNVANTTNTTNSKQTVADEPTDTTTTNVGPTSATLTVTLSLVEAAKHNSISDCWIVVSDKVYDITAYFGGHPGGDSTMSPTCGKDATAAFYTKDPYATVSSTRSSHSSRAASGLTEYFIGNLNENIAR